MPDTPILAPADIRARVGSGAASLPQDDTNGNALIAEWIQEFTEVLVDYRGFSPGPTTETLTATTAGCSRMLLLRPPVRSVTSLTVAGSVVAGSGYSVSGADGILTYSHGFSTGQAITVVYVHGLAAPTAIIKSGCREYVLAKAKLSNSGTSRDIIGQSADGSYIRYSTPDKAAGRPTGFAEVDRLLNSLPDYRIPGAA